MKSVLISIQPKWCEKIAKGEKTIEVRKTRPKLETPFKCYIYCTNSNGTLFMAYDGLHYGKDYVGRFDPACVNGKVIGEFVCDKVFDLPFTPAFQDYDFTEIYRDNGYKDFSLKSTCLTQNEIYEYGKGKVLYGWHISDLVIYDKPKELSEFKAFCRDAYFCTGDCFCKDGYGSCAVKDKEKEYPYNDECIYFDCPTCGESGYEDYAYCLCDGLKPVTRPPQSWQFIDGE